MRHFDFLSEEQHDRLFFRVPKELHKESDAADIATALGATLYSPATRPQLVRDVLKLGSLGGVSMVICLEDSVPDEDLLEAEDNVLAAMAELHTLCVADPSVQDRMPMLFLRPRAPAHMRDLARRIGPGLRLLSGFAAPKFENETGLAQDYFDALSDVRAVVANSFAATPEAPGDDRFWLMPILESPVIVHMETRTQALSRVYDVIKANRTDVLAVRIGATDFSSAFGLRRPSDLTIYDVHVVASVVADIVNILGRPEDALVVTGPVWEHFDTSERMLRPQLRASPFAEAGEEDLRQELLTSNMDNLIREIKLDHANGLLGKTVIHPSHIPLVHALSVVSHEEYADCLAVLRSTPGGAKASPYSNKMNEQKPHRAWAEQILRRANAFGVAAPGINFVDLLESSMQWN